MFRRRINLGLDLDRSVSLKNSGALCRRIGKWHLLLVDLNGLGGRRVRLDESGECVKIRVMMTASGLGLEGTAESFSLSVSTSRRSESLGEHPWHNDNTRVL